VSYKFTSEFPGSLGEKDDLKGENKTFPLEKQFNIYEFIIQA